MTNEFRNDPALTIQPLDAEAPWRFVHTGKQSSAMNMAIDEAMLIAHSEGKTPPTVRFFGWEPATLSIGYFQKAAEEVDFEQLEKRGIGFVRRPTGGRAVLHDQELTYSIIVSEDYPGMPSGVTDAYRVLSVGLQHGFVKLGLNAEMVNLASEDEKAKYAEAGGSAVCFDSPSWYELVVEGRKVAGSAQTRMRGVILQHGSILQEMDTALLFDLLRFPSERVKERLMRAFPDRAAAINELCRERGLPIPSDAQVADAFREGLELGLGVPLVPGELTAYERELAGQLAQDKYGDDVWNLRR